ncbi:MULTISPECIES: hypothetical protein [Burkholderia]|uniref:hypothetical protein n=1 Tax=Burkholderia TaxID=32008 RepID=UPI001178921E|nr:MULTISPECIES: hypothetical protein [Burkholderia]MCI3974477.1 hypothetical protein [Burkholderia sp. HI4860]MDN7789189.1 hypothetical protein [Burkholderia contaminans]
MRDDHIPETRTQKVTAHAPGRSGVRGMRLLGEVEGRLSATSADDGGTAVPVVAGNGGTDVFACPGDDGKIAQAGLLLLAMMYSK